MIIVLLLNLAILFILLAISRSRRSVSIVLISISHLFLGLAASSFFSIYIYYMCYILNGYTITKDMTDCCFFMKFIFNINAQKLGF